MQHAPQRLVLKEAVALAEQCALLLDHTLATRHQPSAYMVAIASITDCYAAIICII